MYQSAQAVRERGTPVSTGGKGERDTQKLSVAPGNRREILSLTVPSTGPMGQWISSNPISAT